MLDVWNCLHERHPIKGTVTLETHRTRRGRTPGKTQVLGRIVAYEPCEIVLAVDHEVVLVDELQETNGCPCDWPRSAASTDQVAHSQ